MLKQVIVLFYLLFYLWPAAAAENFAEKLNLAFQQGQSIPHFTHFNHTATVAEAYQAQREFVSLRQQNDTIAGYKAGLTSTAGQQKFNVKESLSGVLFVSGLVSDGAVVKLSNARKLMLETELGFILAADITAPLSEPGQLRPLVDSVAAVIELPDIGYHSPQQISGLDLIAANVAAHQYIIGDKLSLGEISDINRLSTALVREGQLQFKGSATDALGDQWQALFWLVNQLVAQGYHLAAGEMLITGALGPMVAAELGTYQADFGPLGQIDFRVEP